MLLLSAFFWHKTKEAFLWGDARGGVRRRMLKEKVIVEKIHWDCGAVSSLPHDHGIILPSCLTTTAGYVGVCGWF